MGGGWGKFEDAPLRIHPWSVVGIRTGFIAVSIEKPNITMTVDHKEVYSGGTSISKAKGLRVASGKCQCTLSQQMHLQKQQ